MPKSERAVEAIKANPEKSNRAIAEEIGVSEPTVRRARDSTASYDAVDERIGLDGKTRRMPQYEEEVEETIEDDILPQNIRTAYLLRADQAKQFAVYSGRITSEIVASSGPYQKQGVLIEKSA